MPTLEYFVVCRSVSFDVETDEITLANVIEDIYLNEDGATVLARAVAVGSWNLAEGEQPQDYQSILRIVLSGETQGVDFSMNFIVGRRRYRAIMAITDIPLHTPGVLNFELLLNSTHAAGHQVFVHPPGTRGEAEAQMQAHVGRPTA